MTQDRAVAAGGTSIRNAGFDNITGTFGCLVQLRDTPTQRYVLSASHVMNPGGFGGTGDAIQALVGGQWQKIAELVDWTSLRDRSGAIQRHDAAIARVTAPELVDAAIAGIGMPAGIARWVFEGKRLQCCGAQSGQVRATAQSSGVQAPVFYDDWADVGTYSLPFDDLILYGNDRGGWRPALQAGDSGALVLDEHRFAVGLHIARTDDAHPVQASVCTPIEGVLQAFGIDLELVVTAAGAAVPLAGEAAAGAAAEKVPQVDQDALSQRARDDFGISVMPQLQLHGLRGTARWQLTPDGLVVDNRLDRTGGRLVTVPRVWQDFGSDIAAAAREYQVPMELIVATICTESGGNRSVPSRPESGGRMSVGIMQTLIGTAREALRDNDIDERALREPATSIRAGTAYIQQQRRITAYDAPLVACAYNAGNLHPDDGVANRWGWRQYPLGTGQHADRFVQWFNDCFASLRQGLITLPAGTPSLWRLFWD